MIRALFFTAARYGVFALNFAAASIKATSTKTKVIGAAALVVGSGIFLNQVEENAGIPPMEAPRGYNLPVENAPAVKDRIAVKPDVYGNIVLPGSLIAKTYLETIYDPQTQNFINSMPSGPAKDARIALVAEHRAILLDAITKYEDLPFDGFARATIAAIQEQQMAASRRGDPDKTKSEEYHQMMPTSSTVLEIRQRAKMLVEKYPELQASEEQVRQLDALFAYTPGTSKGTSIITTLTTLPPAAEMGIYSYMKYRDQVIQAAARYVVVDMGGRQGNLEPTKPAETDHAALKQPVRFTFG